MGDAILIIGAARSGVASAEYLLSIGKQIVISDMNTKLAEDVETQLGHASVSYVWGKQPDVTALQPELIVMSPGVPLSIPPVVKARELGIPVISEPELAFRYSDVPFVAITGTNGKTTTVTLLYDLVRALGYKAGLVSTVVYKVGERIVEATHTTPDPVRLNAMMREMADEGCEYCFMECSSHAIVQQRTRGLHFAGGIFSNITHDHLDYHKTFAEYIRAKKLFFDSLAKDAFALTNADDKNGRVMVQNTAAGIHTYSLRTMADFRCKIVEMHVDGMLLRIDGQEVWVGLVGRFNAYNLLAVYGAAVLLGLDRTEVLRAMSMLHAVSGRFEFVRAENGTTAIVDYAHTPDALENVIQTIEEIRTPAQQLIVVCGCGGDRDRTKRPEMAQIAVKYADTAIFTSDNPRHESPGAILDEMAAGLDPGARFLRIVDRAEAIRTAAMLSRPGDILLIAGKGHETYQIIGDVKHHFDDKEEVAKAFGTLRN